MDCAHCNKLRDLEHAARESDEGFDNVVRLAVAIDALVKHVEPSKITVATTDMTFMSIDTLKLVIRLLIRSRDSLESQTKSGKGRGDEL